MIKLFLFIITYFLCIVSLPGKITLFPLSFKICYAMILMFMREQMDTKQFLFSFARLLISIFFRRIFTMKKDTRYLVSVALMAAIVILLANTPLGMIQLPIIKATTVHIPVIIGAILLGPSAGAILGAIFGICSLISNTTAPTLLSFAFSPFLSTTGLVGVVKAIWISVGCRIVIGVISGWLWILFRKLKANSYLSLIITGFVGSMVNTIFVMGSIYLLFAGQYAAAKDVARTAVFGLIMGTVTASGIPEAIAAAILVTVITKALLKVVPNLSNASAN